MFKNAIPYRITEPLNLTGINDDLGHYQSQTPGALMSKHCGFVAPDKDRPDELARNIAGVYFIRMKTNEKLLPASVITAEVDKRVADQEALRGKLVGKTDKSNIKEQVMLDLLPKAFIKSTVTDCYIDTAKNLIVINTPTFNKAEELLSLLRKALGSLPVIPIVLNDKISTRLTDWVGCPDIMPAYLGQSGRYALFDQDEESKKARFNQYEAEELFDMIESGSVVSSMSINWYDNLDFVLDDDFKIKSIKDLSEVVSDDDEASAYESDALVNSVITKLIESLIREFGGECSV